MNSSLLWSCEPVVEETKPARPAALAPEEVEKRAREREQLAAWYQPIPEPVKDRTGQIFAESTAVAQYLRAKPLPLFPRWHLA